LRDSENGLQKWSISLCGSSVRGTWRGGCFAGDPEGYGEEGSEDWPHFLWGVPLGSLVGGLSTGDLCKAQETGISLHRGPFGMHVGGGAPFTGNSER